MKQTHAVRLRLAITLLLGVTCIAAACAEYTRPPLLQIGRLESVAIDGRIGDGEWSGATEVGLLIGPDGRPTDASATVWIGWDNDGLAILWELRGDPEYVRRDRDADIWRDDAVEVRLQSGDGDSIHRFGINAGGSIYDARDGDAAWNPLWRALTLRGIDGWRVEMHIPFASFNAQPGEMLRANLIVNDAKINAPVASWASLAQDDAEQLGFLQLAPRPSPVVLRDVEIEGDTATVLPHFSGPTHLQATLFEDGTEVRTLQCEVTEPTRISLPHPGEFRLRLAGTGADGELVLQREFRLVRLPPMVLTARKRLLSAREIDVMIDGAGLATTPDHYLLSAPGVGPVQVDPDADHTARVTLDMSHCAAGEIAVTAMAVAGDEELATETLRFVLPPRPDWAGSTLGKHARLMEPWTPVRATDNRVVCWDRIYDLGEQLLPVSIKSGRKELLAGPVSLRARVSGTLREWDEATVRWLETADTHAVAAIIANSPLAEARIRMSCEYDGLMNFDIKVNPRGDGTLSAVQVEIPVAAEFASHMQISDGTIEGLTASLSGGKQHTQAFAPMVWLSGFDRGLQWLCESDASWSLENPSVALRIRPGRERTTLLVTMLDHELLPGESFKANFGLQATPVRSRAEDRQDRQAVMLDELPLVGGACDATVMAALSERGISTVIVDDEGYYLRPGGLGEAADVTLAEFAQLCHEAGLRVMGVIDDDLMRDPVWEAFRAEVASTPAVEGEPLRPCPGSAWADYVVEAAAYAMEQYDLDGIHLRGGANLRSCASGTHGEGIGRVTGARELMMRLRTVVHERNPEARLTVAFPEGTPAAAAGFADGLLVEATTSEGALLTPDELVARGGAGALGTAIEVALRDTPDPVTISKAVGTALLHGAALRPSVTGPSCGAAAAVRQAQEEFDVASARWRPWWSDRLLVTTEAPDVLISCWWREGEVLASVVNLGEAAPVVEIAFNRDRLKLGSRVLAVDVLAGNQVPQIGGGLRMRMEAGQTSLIHVRTRNEREVDFDDDE